MTRVAKIFFLCAVMSIVMLPSFADRGVGKKTKKITLNIKTNGSFTNSLALNLKAGLKYRGSLLSNIQTTNTGAIYNTLVSYQKGNTIYIIPYKQKVIVPEIQQGYTGMKLIIRTN